jgi:predicted acetyltransferase
MDAPATAVTHTERPSTANTMQDLEVRLATPDDRLPLYRMLELYQHDLSDVWEQDLDSHGEYGYPLDRFWHDPRCQPFVFLVAGRYAGFALVDDAVKLEGDERWMAQFCVLKKYRRQGIGRIAAQAIFDRLRGRWQVGQMPLNLPAQTFWRRTIGEYTNGHYVEHVLDDERWEGVLQCFDNRQRSGMPPQP